MALSRIKWLLLLSIISPLGIRAQTVVPIVAGIVTADVSRNSSFKTLLTANITSVVFSSNQAPVGGQTVVYFFTENAVGGFTVTFSAGIVNGCTVTATANTTTACEFRYNGTDGLWYGIGGSGGGGATPGGNNNNIQFKNGTNFAGSNNLTWDPTPVTGGLTVFGPGGFDLEGGSGAGNGIDSCTTSTVCTPGALTNGGVEIFAQDDPGAQVLIEANSNVSITSSTGSVNVGAVGSSSGAFKYFGTTSGSRKFGVAAVAGSAADVLMPTASCTSGQVWISNGGSPEQYSCITLPTFQTNNTPNVTQSVLNLKAGLNMTLTPDGSGGVVLDAATNPGACTIPTLVNGDFLTTNGSTCSWTALSNAPANTPAVQGKSIIAYDGAGNFTQSSGQPCSPQFSSTDTLTAAATSPTETVFATQCSIPANTIVTGAVIRALVGLDWTATATVPNFTFRVKLCTVSGCGSGTVINLYTSATNAPTAGTFSSVMPILIQGEAAAGATATIAQSIGVGVGTNAPFGRNSVTTHVANVPTNGTLFLSFSATFSTNAATNSMTLTQLVFQP